MPIINRVAEMADEVAVWRRDFHQHPELLYEVHRTAAKVAELLASFGVDEVATGIGRTGVVGVIKGRVAGPRTIALRADMDALPITEIRDTDHKSVNPGLMHACGHDGHTAMLLGAAKYLAETRNFAGTVVVVFQPAEEGGAGGLAMVEDGLMERFHIDEVYGMHNMPNLPVGHFATRPGALMGCSCTFDITLTGLGGHAAKPHSCLDPIVAGSQIVTALQSIVARRVNPLDSAVISVTRFHAGTTANNIIPQTAVIGGTVRALKDDIRAFVVERVETVARGIAAANDLTVEVKLDWGYPVVMNHTDQTAFAAAVAAGIIGTDNVDTDVEPTLGGEDFSYMLLARPGAFVFIGNGETAGLHHPEYDFSDAVIPYGVSYWAKLTEAALPL